MKFNKLSQLFLVSILGLLAAISLAGCLLVAVDYVFVTTSTGATGDGQIQIYDVDAASGALHTGTAAAVSSGGANPVALAVTSDYANLYVANQGTSNNIVHFSIAASGALTLADTVSGLGTPVAIAVNKAGTYLFAVFQGTTATLAVIPLSSSGAMSGASVVPVQLTIPSYGGDTVVPTGVTALDNNSAVYVTAYDSSAYNPGGTVSSSNPNPGYLFGFTVGSGGALAATSGSPYEAGVKPVALTADPTSRFVYVTDFAESQMIGYTVLANGTLQFFLAPPTATGREPNSVTFDPRGLFIYVTNELDATVTAYALNLGTGAPTQTNNSPIGSATSAINGTDPEPVAIAVEPALGRFVFTANYLGNSVSGFRLNPTSGALSATQGTPYPVGQSPTALLAVPHGNHATQSVTP